MRRIPVPIVLPLLEAKHENNGAPCPFPPVSARPSRSFARGVDGPAMFRRTCGLSRQCHRSPGAAGRNISTMGKVSAFDLSWRAVLYSWAPAIPAKARGSLPACRLSFPASSTKVEPDHRRRVTLPVDHPAGSHPCSRRLVRRVRRAAALNAIRYSERWSRARRVLCERCGGGPAALLRFTLARLQPIASALRSVSDHRSEHTFADRPVDQSRTVASSISPLRRPTTTSSICVGPT